MNPSLLAVQVVGATIIVGLLVLFMFWRFNDNGRRSGAPKLPPGPRPWPIVGNFPLLSALLHQDFKKLSDVYGPILYLRLGSVDAIVISSPALAEEVLKTKDITFASRPKSSCGMIMVYDHASVGLSPYGPYWRHARKVYTLELMTIKQIRQFEKERSAELVRALDSIINGCKGGKAVLIDRVLWTITANNICRMAFAKTYFADPSKAATESDMESRRFAEALRELLRLLTVVVMGDFIPILKNFDIGGHKKQMREVSRQLDQVLENILEEHQQKMLKRTTADAKGEGKKDLVEVLLTSSADNETPLTREQVKALLLEVIGAGIETQVTSLSWAFSELLKNPSVLSRAQKELDSVIGNNRMVQEADLPHLTYIQAIVKENFRLHPPAPLLVPRQSSEASSLGNGSYHIPKNTMVFVNAWAMGREPSLWENPLAFNPERFLETDIDSSGKVFKFLPFGSGRRTCPGRQLALVMVEYSLAVFLHTCNWALPQGVSPKDVDMTEAPGLTVGRKVPLEIEASPRLPLSVIFGTP